MYMAEREQKTRMHIVWVMVIAAVLLLCILGGMHVISGWVVLTGVIIGVVIVAYAYWLRETERKCEQLEEQLAQEQERNQTLSERLLQEQEQAAAQLEEERITARRMVAAERAVGEEAKEKLVSQLAHELRLPISVAAGYAELLRDGLVEDPEEQQEYLAKICDRLHQINVTLSRNLSSAHDSQDNLGNKIQRTDFDLIDFMKKNLDDCRSMAREYGIEIQLISLLPSLPVSADPVLLQYIIDNLLENAMKYMGRPGNATFVVTQERDNVCLAYRDDGLGVDAVQAAHIFENGFRGSNANAASGNGHGLHFVSMIVQAHGGSCLAESKLGEGLRLQIHLPIALPAKDVAE